MTSITPANGSNTSTASHQAPGFAPAEDSEPELLARFFRVLGDPTRVRLMQLLLDAPTGECMVGELASALSAPQSRVSTH